MMMKKVKFRRKNKTKNKKYARLLFPSRLSLELETKQKAEIKQKNNDRNIKTNE